MLDGEGRATPAAPDAAEFIASAESLLTALVNELDVAPVESVDPGIGASRQAVVMLSLVEAARALDRVTAARSIAEGQANALAICIAVQISAVSLAARRLGRFDRHGRLQLGGRMGMLPQLAFAEPGIDLWRHRWRRQTELMLSQFDRASAIKGEVRPVQGDAVNLRFEDATFDAVICDPPYFDNIQYADESAPYYGWLRLLIRSLPGVFVGLDPLRSAEVSLDRTVSDRDEAQSRYEDLLRRSIREAERVLRPDRCMALLYPLRDPSGLKRFLEVVQPEGVELVEAIKVHTEPAFDSATRVGAEVTTYVLLLRKSRLVVAVKEASVDADRVLELADTGRATLYAAVASILDEEWAEEDFECRVPADLTGTRLEQIAEVVADCPDPAELLAELGRRTLRKHADRLGLAYGRRPPDAVGLALGILGAVGFTVPAPLAFTFTAQIDNLRTRISEAVLSQSIDLLRGVFLAGSDNVQAIVRLGSIAWLRVIKGERWHEGLVELFKSARDVKQYPGVDGMSLVTGLPFSPSSTCSWMKSRRRFIRCWQDFADPCREARVSSASTA